MPISKKILLRSGRGGLTSSQIITTDLQVGVLDIDLASVSSSDDTLASAKAIKTYVDIVGGIDTLAGLTDTAIDSVASAQVLIYDGTNSWDNKTVSGDMTITTSGVIAIGVDKVTGTMIHANAVDDSSLEQDGTQFRIKAVGVTNAMLAGSIANGKLSGPAIAVTDGTTSSNITPGGTLTFSSTTNETTVAQSGGTVTVGLPSNVTIGGILTVTGNLVVNGTTTTVNSTTVTVDDPIFTLGGDTAPGSDDNKDRGIAFRYYDGSAKIGFFGYDDSTDVFTGFTTATNTSEVFSGTVMNAIFGNVTASTQSANNNSTYAATTAYVQTELTAYTSDTVTFTNKSISGEQINSGTVADARIAATLSRITNTETLPNKTLTSPILNGTLSGTAFLDEDNFSSNSAIAVASQQSIAAYIAAQITAEDLDVTADSGTIDIDLNSEILTIAGGTGLASAASGTTVTLNIDSTVATLTGTQTLTNKTLTAPKIVNDGFIADANGAEQIIFVTTGSAVNELTITNGSTGVPATIASSGESNIGLRISGSGTGGVILHGVATKGSYLEFGVKQTTVPDDPSTELARMYLKEIDANNNAIAVKIQKAGGIVEVEITSPKAICAVCGSKDGALDPIYDFSRSMMVVELWCGHIFEVPMQWSQINDN